MLQGLLPALVLLFAPSPSQGPMPDPAPLVGLDMRGSTPRDDNEFCLAVMVEVRQGGYLVMSRDDDGTNPRETAATPAELPALLRAITASPMQCDRIFVGAADETPYSLVLSTASMLRSNGFAAIGLIGEGD